ncbi:MAG: hypothetical protein K8F53_05675 [Rhodocyclaceae bacterium]|nr:hypothetical protein [Rhodocyclaceae bacterium]
MEEWEEFSAFGDVAELEHVCGLLGDRASAIRDGIPVEVADLMGSDSTLIKRLENQDTRSAAILSAARPDRPWLYARTWMAKLIADLCCRLSEIAERPQYLPGALPRLELDFHKVLIAAHDVFDPHHLATLVASALIEGEAGVREERSQQSREAVKARRDQETKAVFLDWAKGAIAEGKKADTVNELQGLEGFNPLWSKMAEKTLKKWAVEAGFKLKSGRPKKKK